VLTHGDPDHAGGLADFPEAAVHVSAEELANVRRGSWRYVPRQFEHGPRWVTYERPGERWFGVEARPVDLGIASRVLFICLPGHTFGHCGVAIEREDGRWLLHAGDAYYLRVETERDDHPVSKLAAQRADDNSQRLASLGEIRRLLREHGDRIEIFGYHDPGELQL
jgi:glyoxylase-like metal-dependent hydrolase (beta-lactamase superfamily II)